MTSDFKDSVYGCLIGGAIGDALGASVEGWTHEEIREKYGTVQEFKQYYMPYSDANPGSITSDTAMRHYLCLAIAEHGGRVQPPEFAKVICEHMDPNRVWINEEIILKKLTAGLNPWDTGRGAVPNNHITSAITPIGIVNVGDPEQAYQDGINIASMLQEGPHRHMTATVAAGIAEAMMPQATVESITDTMLEQAEGMSARALDLALGYAEEARTMDDCIEILYDRFLDWRWPAVQWDRDKYREGGLFSASTLETVPVAIAILNFSGDDVNRSIIEGVNYGRDSDAIATLTGSFGGALNGSSVIRESWIKKCENQNQEFFAELGDETDSGFYSMAKRLVKALKNERKQAKNRHNALDQLLNDS